MRLIDSGDQYAVKPENLRTAQLLLSAVGTPMAISMAQQWVGAEEESDRYTIHV